MFPKQFRVEDEKVLEKVRGQGCCVCGRHPVDASHIKTRGSGGPDTEWNVVAHCRSHHIEWGTGWSRFIRRNPTMAIVLTRLGWKWDDLNLTHPGLDKTLDETSETTSSNYQPEAKPLSKSEKKRRDLTSSR